MNSWFGCSLVGTSAGSRKFLKEFLGFCEGLRVFCRCVQ